MTSEFVLMMLGIIMFGVGLGVVGVALIDWVAHWQKHRHPKRRELTREEYLKLREERENFPGMIIVDGHVVSDRFGEQYGGKAMTDDELPAELRTKVPE